MFLWFADSIIIHQGRDRRITLARGSVRSIWLGSVSTNKNRRVQDRRPFLDSCESNSDDDDDDDRGGGKYDFV